MTTIMGETRRVDLDAADPDRVLALLESVQLRGHGGAGFPTAVKLAAARGRHPDLIVNACDSEPAVDKDAVLLRHRPNLVADGIGLLADILRPRRVLVAVHTNGPGREAAYELAATAPVPTEVIEVPDRYTAGEESALVATSRGRRAKPLFHPEPLPLRSPTPRGRPAVVHNAETVARVAAAWLNGYAVPTRLVSLGGDVSRPAALEANLDASVADLVGSAAPQGPPQAVLVGGWAGQWRRWSDITGTTLRGLGRDLGAGLVHVHTLGCPLPVVARLLDHLAAESAGQCGPCMFGLPALADDWRALAGGREAVDTEDRRAAAYRLNRRADAIRGRGGCGHPDAVVRMAVSATDVFADEIAAHASGRCPAGEELTTLVGAA